MGILTISTKENWDRVEQAVKDYRHKLTHGDDRVLYGEKDEEGNTQARRYWNEMEAEILEALEPVRIPKHQLWNQIAKLCMANNTDRALKLIKAARSDLQLRWPVQLVVNIVAIPFRLIYWIIKLIAP